MTTPWSVPREWVGETVVILGGGPSMNRATADYARGKARVIAVNSQGIDVQTKGEPIPALAPWADVLYAGDPKWWNDPFNQPRALAFAGLRVTMRDLIPFPEVLSLEKSELRQPYDERPSHIVQGGNSGYQAIHLAAQFGAKRILLCGYNMNGGHWFGNYHSRKLNTRPSFSTWVTQLSQLFAKLAQMGVEVINCTPHSAMSCNKRARLEEVLH